MVTILRIIWRGIRFGLRLISWLIGFLLLTFLLQSSTFPFNTQWNAVALTVANYQFDYLGWEVNALAAKADETLFGVHPFIDEADRSQFVRDYMADLGAVQRIEAQINANYTNPNIANPSAESANLRAQRDTLRADLRSRQTLVEAILEGQVAAVLTDQGFGVLGQLVPPIAMRFSQVPNLLIVSPRDQIRFDISINVDPLPVDKITALEATIDSSQDVSSLIVPLGGIALYPAMIVETSSLQFAVETFAHEWLHHYLFMFPLGLNYDFSGEARTINETTADLFGKEVGRLVLERYYPDLVPPPPDPDATPTPSQEAQPPVFDFGAEMNITRVTVDHLLADGHYRLAEIYMELRRRYFVANGYGIRKINQAFFAFYGGYQAGGVPGVGGEDPIGPAIRDLRAASPSLHEWILIMRGITTRDDLLAIRDTTVTP